MTDLEMTKLCADAMGYHVPNFSNAPNEVHVVGADGKTCTLYAPLHDNAQAMALVKELNLAINPGLGLGWVVHPLPGNARLTATNRDLNRAIVECCSRMQAAKQDTPSVSEHGEVTSK